MKRMFLLAAVAAMTTLSLAGCSKGNTTTNESQGTAASSTSAASTPETKKSGSDSPDTTARRTTGSTAGTGSTGSTTRGGNASTTLPGIPNIPNTPGGPDITDIPGVPKDIQKCVDISTAYLALFAPFVSGNAYDEAQLQKAVETLEKIKADVPSSVRQSLEILEEGIKNIKSQADMVKFFTSDEFTKANDIVTKYVTVECQTAG